MKGWLFTRLGRKRNLDFSAKTPFVLDAQAYGCGLFGAKKGPKTDQNGAKSNQWLHFGTQNTRRGRHSISEIGDFDDLEREIEKRTAEDRLKPPAIHAGDCTCDACYPDADLIARMEEEWRQW